MHYLLGLFTLFLSLSSFAEHMEVYDQLRDRKIPISVQYPANKQDCNSTNQCKVVFISAGNRVPYEKYNFISTALTDLNYLVISIDHELPSDPSLSKVGNLYKSRIENWERGANNINFIHDYLSEHFLDYDFNNITLIGHSNGGNISTWFVTKNSTYIDNLITLDHKRVTLPKNKNVKTLSIRSPEYPTKKGVLLTKEEQKDFDICIVSISDSKHMDLTDYGKESIKIKTRNFIEEFLSGKSCDVIKM